MNYLVSATLAALPPRAPWLVGSVVVFVMDEDVPPSGRGRGPGQGRGRPRKEAGDGASPKRVCRSTPARARLGLGDASRGAKRKRQPQGGGLMEEDVEVVGSGPAEDNEAEREGEDLDGGVPETSSMSSGGHIDEAGRVVTFCKLCGTGCYNSTPLVADSPPAAWMGRPNTVVPRRCG